MNHLRNLEASNKVRASVVTFKEEEEDYESFSSTGALLTLKHAISSAIPIYHFEKRTSKIFVLTGVFQHGPRCADQKYGIVKIDFNRREISKHSGYAKKNIAIATVSNI